MTSGVIYHNFQQTNPQPKGSGVLTERVLRKGRRWHKFWNHIGQTADTTCIALCGGCIALSLLVLCHILFF